MSDQNERRRSPESVDPLRGETGIEEEAPGRAPSVRTALVVDDNGSHRVLSTGLLQSRGFAVLEAHDGLEAVELFGDGRFDFVLMDLQMPRLDGFEAAVRMRDLERDRERTVPIIAVSSLSSPEDRRRATECGIDQCLTKPLEPVMVDEVIERFLDSPPDFEPDRALQRAAGNEDLLALVLRLFLEQTPERLRALHAALDAGDREGLAGTAWRISGTAHELAMTRLRRIAHEVAVASARGDFERAAELTAELEAVFGRGQSQIRRMLDSA